MTPTDSYKKKQNPPKKADQKLKQKLGTMWGLK